MLCDLNVIRVVFLSSSEFISIFKFCLFNISNVDDNVDLIYRCPALVVTSHVSCVQIYISLKYRLYGYLSHLIAQVKGSLL